MHRIWLSLVITSLLSICQCLNTSTCTRAASTSQPLEQASNQQPIKQPEGDLSTVEIDSSQLELAGNSDLATGPYLEHSFELSDLLRFQPVQLPENMVKFSGRDNLSQNRERALAEPVWAQKPVRNSEKSLRELYWFKGATLEVVDGKDETPVLTDLAGTLSVEVDQSFRDKLFPEGKHCSDKVLLTLTQGKPQLILPAGFAVPAASDEHWKIKINATNRSNKTRRARLKCRLYFIRDYNLVYPITPLHWQPAGNLPSSKPVVSNFFADFQFVRPEWKSDPNQSAPFCGVPSVENCIAVKTASAIGSNTGTKQTHDSDQYPLFDANRDGPLLKEIKKVELQTTAGSITLTIDPQLAPSSATQIYRLLLRGAYDGTPLFRYEPNFVIQAANVEEKVAGAERLPDQTRALLRRLPLEIQAQKQGLILHKPFVLSLGHWDDDPNSAVSSFSMIIGSAPHLDGKYTIFGKIAQDSTSVATFERIKEQWPKKPTILKACELHP